MNVGELRRALEDVSVTREVCFWNEFQYQKASEAGTKLLVPAEDVGFNLGDYVDAEHYPSPPSGWPNTKLAFVIE